MTLQADTSLLISYYINDANRARSQALIQGSASALCFTGLRRLEMKNALAKALGFTVIP